jgi:hypothetical protein
MTWASWFEGADRHVAFTNVNDGEYYISTVFLGVNYNPFKGPPVVWETMVFKGDESMWFDRCAGSREQAEAMHERMFARIRRRILNGSATDKVTHQL